MVTGDKENLSTNLSSIMSPANTSLSGTPKSSIRPLTQAYQTVHAEHEVTIPVACFAQWGVTFSVIYKLLTISYMLPLDINNAYYLVIKNYLYL